jgi:hypothetical protein
MSAVRDFNTAHDLYTRFVTLTLILFGQSQIDHRSAQRPAIFINRSFNALNPLQAYAALIGHRIPHHFGLTVTAKIALPVYQHIGFSGGETVFKLR